MKVQQLWSQLVVISFFFVFCLCKPHDLDPAKCLGTTKHKKMPSPELNLSECKQWKEKSCCSADKSSEISDLSLHNFDYDHCSEQHLSDKCRKHFVQDLCFFSCSPNVWPWVQQVNMKTRKERIFEVPLCRSECDAWFKDCSYDFTCVDNWYVKFKWGSEGSQCPDNKPCKTFKEIYKNATNFCQTVWDSSWKVVDDSQPCMKLWFNSTYNPNEEVVQSLFRPKNNGSTVKSLNIALIAVSTVFFLLLC